MKVFARTPIDMDRLRLPHGRLHIISERCKGCRFCVEFCPRQALEISSNTNSKGYHFPQFAAGGDDACVACGFCTIICPEFAIYVLEEEPCPAAAS
jgi:2-oxoglutarate ferredoxin oxidoreductase subunit delta